MSGGIARKWHIVILPEDEYKDYAMRVVSFTGKFGKDHKKTLSSYISDGFMPVLFRDDVNFLFQELEIPSDVAGLISRSTAETFGYVSIDDNTSKP